MAGTAARLGRVMPLAGCASQVDVYLCTLRGLSSSSLSALTFVRSCSS